MQLFISFCGEGPTDERVFRNLTERIINKLFLEKGISAEISWMSIRKKGSSEESLLSAAKESHQQSLLICHRDADCNNREQCLESHFNSGLEIIENDDSGQFCQSIVLAIPIQETEAWMLCDKELLKEIMETSLNNETLELTYQISRIEDISNPKARIEKALNIHKHNLPARKRRLTVNLSDLYEPFSQEISFDNLENLNSFNKFRNDLGEVIENIIS